MLVEAGWQPGLSEMSGSLLEVDAISTTLLESYFQ